MMLVQMDSIAVNITMVKPVCLLLLKVCQYNPLISSSYSFDIQNGHTDDEVLTGHKQRFTNISLKRLFVHN